MNLPDNHEELATGHATLAIVTFFLVGLLLVTFSSARFLSLRTLLFFVVGMFVISVASAGSYTIGLVVARHGSRRWGLEQLPTVRVAFKVFNFAYNVAASWLVFRLFF